jgi:hypothetical protein
MKMTDGQTSTGGEDFAQAPIEAALHAMASEPELPDAAVMACFDRFEEAAPALRAVLARAADGENLSDDDATLLFRGLYILGARRDTATCRPLLKMLRLSQEDLDFLLGDLVTVSLPIIAASVFDGDADALFDVIADREVDEFIRNALLGAAAFLTWDGKIDDARMVGFLERFYRERPAEDHEIVWDAWLVSIAALGLRHLEPLANHAFHKWRIVQEIIEWRDFEEILAEAERAPDDIGRFKKEHWGYIDDVIESLEWSRHAAMHASGKVEAEPTTSWSPPPSFYHAEPVRNPMRDVGRNDPCPCGSGKKAKRCCLAK